MISPSIAGHGERREAVPARRVEAVDGLDQADRPDLDEVVERFAARWKRRATDSTSGRFRSISSARVGSPPEPVCTARLLEAIFPLRRLKTTPELENWR